MATHLMVVMTDPAEGKDDEFNRFLDDEHLPDVLRAEGMVRAHRFRVGPAQPDFVGQLPSFTYLTLYEIETDDVTQTISALESSRAAGEWRRSDSPSPDRVCAVYEHLGSVEAAASEAAAIVPTLDEGRE